MSYWRQTWRNFQNVRAHSAWLGGPLSNGDPQAPLLPDHFQMLVWNVFKGGGGEAFEQDLQQLAEQSDVLCLQEVLFHDTPQIAHLVADHSYDYAPSYRRQDQQLEGVMTCSRWRHFDVAGRHPSVGRELWVRTPKATVVSVLPTAAGGELLVINTHMLLLKTHQQLLRELDAVLTAVAAWQDRPSLFVGDFNTFLPRQLRQLDAALAPAGYRRIEPAGKRRLKNLDHIYARGLSEVRVEVLQGINSSDHKPLSCRIRLA